MTSAEYAAVAGPPVHMTGAGRAGPVTILAAYTCSTCDIEGRDAEVSPGQVLCWNCGEPGLITARVAG